MPETNLTERQRQAFETMFTGLEIAMSNEDREEASRAAFAIMQPMAPAQEAMNRYKLRVAYAVKSRDTTAGLAAVLAFQEDLSRCVSSGDGEVARLNMVAGSMLRRAADIASKGAVSRELGMMASPIHGMRFSRALEIWLKERLAVMDAEIALADEAEAGNLPAPA